MDNYSDQDAFESQDDTLERQPTDMQPMIDDEDYTQGRPLLAFKGPSDLPREENRRWFLLIITVSVLFILGALLLNRVLLAVILIGVAWLTYMLSKIPTQDVETVITTTGFFTQNKFYPWSQLNGFWIIKDHGHYVLGLDRNRRPFSSIMILLGAQNPIEIKQVLQQYIPFREDRRQDTLNLIIEKSSIMLDRFYSSLFNQIKQRAAKRPAPPPATNTAPTPPVEAPAPQNDISESMILDPIPPVDVPPKQTTFEQVDALAPKPHAAPKPKSSSRSKAAAHSKTKKRS